MAHISRCMPLSLPTDNRPQSIRPTHPDAPLPCAARQPVVPRFLGVHAHAAIAPPGAQADAPAPLPAPLLPPPSNRCTSCCTQTKMAAKNATTRCQSATRGLELWIFALFASSTVACRQGRGREGAAV